MASFPEAVLRPANAVSDLSQGDGNVYEDIPTSGPPGPPDLPPRKGRLIPPFTSKDSGPPGLGSSGGFAHQNVQPHSVPSTRRSEHTGESGSTAKSQGKMSQESRSSYGATNVYSNFDSPAMVDRPPLPLPEPQLPEKMPKVILCVL